MNTKVCTASAEDAVHLDAVAARLNDICRSATFDLAHRVGALIIDVLYGGDVQQWLMDRGGRPSYRALAKRKDLLLSASALCRAVGVFVLSKRVRGSEGWCHLSTSHVQEVLALPFQQQEELLDRAEVERWTVARIRQEARIARGSAHVRRRVVQIAPLVECLRERLVNRTKLLRSGAVLKLHDADAAAARRSIALLREDLTWLDGLLARSSDGALAHALDGTTGFVRGASPSSALEAARPALEAFVAESAATDEERDPDAAAPRIEQNTAKVSRSRHPSVSRRP